MLLMPRSAARPAPANGSPRPAAGRAATSAVAKELVHLSYDEYVLIKGCTRVDDSTFLLTAQWPAGTGRAVPGCGTRFESLIMAQTIRQGGLMLAHSVFGAPADHQTLLRTFDFTVDPQAQLAPGKPDHLFILVSCKPVNPHPKRRLTRLRLEMDIRSGDTSIGTGATDFEWIAPAVYRRIRGSHEQAVHEQPPLPAPVPAPRVGRSKDSEVVLAASAEPRRWQLRSDFSNTFLYDHAVDHVPGLVLIEAAHQAACLVTSPGVFLPRSVTTTFDRYVEFDSPCWIEAEVRAEGGDTTVTVTGHQGGLRVFRTDLTGRRHRAV
ncbi:ScbA/BarX family gamma-butyrolactone biosynthesis protein [Streptomyces sp. NPDC047097]|uniref:ScbA/BarX family gamma-butyrolactone biosynthesis protein n=1 Tax=Streptomyces sp. NPDC047097 TaxID=3155260 RepID=UPI0033E8F8FB